MVFKSFLGCIGCLIGQGQPFIVKHELVKVTLVNVERVSTPLVVKLKHLKGFVIFVKMDAQDASVRHALP